MNTDTTSNEHAKTGPNIDSGGLHPAGTKHHAVQAAPYLQCRLHRTAFAMIPFGGSSTASSPHLLRSTGFTGLSAYFSHIGYTDAGSDLTQTLLEPVPTIAEVIMR